MGMDSQLDALTIEDNNTGNEFRVGYIQKRNIGQEKPVTSIQIPGKLATNNKLMSLQGMVRNVRLKAKLVEDGQDKSLGTAPTDGTFTNDEVTTVDDQEYWLFEYLHNPDFQVDWTIKNSDFRVLEGLTVHLETMDSDYSIDDNGVFRQLDLRMVVGSTV